MGMNSKRTLTAAVALACIAAPAAVFAQKVDQKLSIDASPNTVTFGKNLTITGQLTGGTPRDVSGQNVTLERDAFPYDGRFEKVDTNDTNPTGHYKFTLQPTTNAQYRTSAKRGTQSGVITVPVRVAVKMKVSDRTLNGPARVRFSGTVAPPHDDKVARVQRRTSSGWKNVAKLKLVDDGDIVSKYSKRVRISRTGRYRVRFNPADGDHAAGNSRKVRITVG